MPKKNDHAIAARVAAHLFVLAILVFGGDEVGRRLGDYFYYHAFHGIDPIGGPTALRLILNSIGSGLCSGLACGIYGRLTSLKYKYVLYCFAYTALIAAKVALFALVYRAFPFSVEFWTYEIAVLLIAAAIGVSVAEFLVSLLYKRRGQG
jgi:hypothetical protein